jgi:hypothetical protein
MTLIDVLKTRDEYFNKIEVKGEASAAYLEIGNPANAFIDLKSPFSDDYDVRLGTIGGTSATLETSANQQLTISAGSGNVSIQPNASGKVGIGVSSPTQKLHVDGTILTTALSVVGSSTVGVIEVGGPTGAFIDLKGPNSDDYDLRILTNGTDSVISSKGILTLTQLSQMLITNLPIYADNAAAIAGGLSNDSIYKTASGDLRIRV